MNTPHNQEASKSKSTQLLDYKEQKLCIGIDVHKNRWQWAVLCQGIVLSNVSVAASAEAVIAYLHKHYPGADYHCVYACGGWGFTRCRPVTDAEVAAPGLPAPKGKGRPAKNSVGLYNHRDGATR